MRNDSEGAAVLVGLGGLFIFAAIGIEGWRTFVWLQYGYWPSLTTADAWYGMHLAAPAFSWVGVQQLAENILGAQLATVLFWTGLPLSALGCSAIR